MFDFHCHILPGMDDGAPDLSVSLEMMRIAAEHGTKAIVATPHVIEGDWLPEWEEILRKLTMVNDLAREAGLQIEVFSGAEVAIHLDLLTRLAGPGPYCINGGNYMLVELPSFEIPDYVDEFFFTIQARGITPILAHPERHPLVAAHPEVVVEWVRRGVLIQVNAASLMGKMGERAANTARLLLNNQLIQVMGSDAHGVKSRRPRLDEAADMVADLQGGFFKQKVFHTNPQQIINGERLALPEVFRLNYPRQGFRLANLFRRRTLK